jgi:cbb3-type cytochrome oxidase maturation protein
MSVIYVALPIALLLGAAGMFACIRCIRDGQYEDLESPPIRILIDDAKPVQQPETLTPN